MLKPHTRTRSFVTAPGALLGMLAFILVTLVAATPISSLKFQGDANANGNSLTNAATLQAANGYFNNLTVTNGVSGPVAASNLVGTVTNNVSAPSVTSAAFTGNAAALTNFPTLNQNTTGNAATSTNFSGSLSGDVTGTQSATVVGKINGTSLAGLATGILKNTTSTGVPSIAVAGTDYQAPLTLTTSNTSGAATLSGNTLNIPQYSGGSSTNTLTFSAPLNLSGTNVALSTNNALNSVFSGTNNFTGTFQLNGNAANTNGGLMVNSFPTFSDTGIVGSFEGSTNSYLQFAGQNASTGTNASFDFVVNNNNSTSTTYYGDFGMNGGNFVGAGSLNLANATYLTATTGDLALGTTTANAIHFVVNNGASDALTISSTGTITTLGSGGCLSDAVQSTYLGYVGNGHYGAALGGTSAGVYWSNNTNASGVNIDTALVRYAAGTVAVVNGYAASPYYAQLGKMEAGTISCSQVPTVTNTITHGGTTGSTSDSYEVVPYQADGTTCGGDAVTTTTNANATLSGGNTNIINFVSPYTAGATGYYIYRTAAGGTPSTTGKIGSVTGSGTTSFTDTGLAGDGSTPPAANTTGMTTDYGHNNTATQTTVTASSGGTVIFSQPEQGASYKVVIAFVNSATGTASYTFPTPFVHAPSEVDGFSLATSISTTSVTITGAGSPKSVVLIGY